MSILVISKYISAVVYIVLAYFLYLIRYFTIAIRKYTSLFHIHKYKYLGLCPIFFKWLSKLSSISKYFLNRSIAKSSPSLLVSLSIINSYKQYGNHSISFLYASIFKSLIFSRKSMHSSFGYSIYEQNS